jgi:hypothetical protein
MKSKAGARTAPESEGETSLSDGYQLGRALRRLALCQVWPAPSCLAARTRAALERACSMSGSRNVSSRPRRVSMPRRIALPSSNQVCLAVSVLKSRHRQLLAASGRAAHPCQARMVCASTGTASPGCGSMPADTRDEVDRLIREAIPSHREGLREHGLGLPEPRNVAGFVAARRACGAATSGRPRDRMRAKSLSATRKPGVP